MAKKAKAKDVPVKKRKTTKTTATPRTDEAPPLGTVAVSVQVECNVQNTSPFDEIVIELGCLGLSEEPDKIIERSGIAICSIPSGHPRPLRKACICTSSPRCRAPARYGFNLFCIYNEACEARTAEPEDEEDAAEAKAA